MVDSIISWHFELVANAIHVIPYKELKEMSVATATMSTTGADDYVKYKQMTLATGCHATKQT